MKPLYKSLLVGGALSAAVVLVPGRAMAAGIYPEFTVDQSVVPGETAPYTGTLSADLIKGAGYTEDLTLRSDGTTFDSVGYATDPSGFYMSDGTVLCSAVTANCGSDSGLNQAIGGYTLYATFASTGTFSGSTFTGTAGSLDLYLDPNVDTSFSSSSLPNPVPQNPTTADVTANSGFSDDLLLATATLVDGQGMLGSGLAEGDFGLMFAVTLTDFGKTFFTSPDPFYVFITLKGQFNNFVPTAGATEQTTGSADAFFAPVPEPATLTLFGIGLAGSALAARRRRRNRQVA